MKKEEASIRRLPLRIMKKNISFSFLLFGAGCCTKERSVHACNVDTLDALRTFCLTSVCVCAVSEAEFVHFCNHCLYSFGCFGSSLWQQSHLRNFCRNKQHCR